MLPEKSRPQVFEFWIFKPDLSHYSGIILYIIYILYTIVYIVYIILLAYVKMCVYIYIYIYTHTHLCKENSLEKFKDAIQNFFK